MGKKNNKMLDTALWLPRKIGAFGVMMTHVNPTVLRVACGYVKEEGFYGAYRHLMRDYNKGVSVKTEVIVDKRAFKKIKDFDSLQTVKIPYRNKPLVSIIIPAYNQFNYTYYCIRSIIKFSKGIDYEIILADERCHSLRTCPEPYRESDKYSLIVSEILLSVLKVNRNIALDLGFGSGQSLEV